jgi:hypothetical protein
MRLGYLYFFHNFLLFFLLSSFRFLNSIPGLCAYILTCLFQFCRFGLSLGIHMFSIVRHISVFSVEAVKKRPYIQSGMLYLRSLKIFQQSIIVVFVVFFVLTI